MDNLESPYIDLTLEELLESFSIALKQLNSISTELIKLDVEFQRRIKEIQNNPNLSRNDILELKELVEKYFN